MQLRLRTKLTLVMTSLVLLVAAVLSGVFAAQLLDQLLQATRDRANDLAGQVFLQAQHSLTDAGQQGLRRVAHTSVLRVGSLTLLLFLLDSHPTETILPTY
jgi:type II secretory pathway pseudopilin PulG